MLPGYNGEEERRAGARYADKMRHLGKPLTVLPEEHKAARDLILKARTIGGMDDQMIAGQVGLNQGGIYKIRTGRTKTMHRSTYESVMRLRPEIIESRAHERKGKVPDGAMRDPVGTQRRVRALRADGFPGWFMGGLLGVTQEAVSDLARRPRAGVYYSTWLEARQVYEKLAGTNPKDHGIPDRSVRYSKCWAAKQGWAPTWCWDEDTIDDPEASPEWTGECGTVDGYYLHLKYSILVRAYREGKTQQGKQRRKVLCEPCVTARQEAEGIVPQSAASDEEIIDALRQGMAFREIAKEFDISTRTVQRVAIELKKTGWQPNKQGPRPKDPSITEGHGSLYRKRK